MRNILKSKKGISPILATLLLIVIAVAAVIVTYAWVMTFTGSTTSQAGAVLTVENVRYYNTSGSEYNIDITLRNSGTADATVDSVYMGTSASDLKLLTSSEASTGTVVAGSTYTIEITGNATLWSDGTTYYFNIGTEEGLSIPFSREA
jgi:archaeal type IV pilus assembly protein PilA